MDNLLSKDYAKKVNSQGPGPLGTHCCLPHHLVFNPRKPGKVRAFNYSAKHNGTSMNDQLFWGPD